VWWTVRSLRFCARAAGASSCTPGTFSAHCPAHLCLVRQFAWTVWALGGKGFRGALHMHISRGCCSAPLLFVHTSSDMSGTVHSGMCREAGKHSQVVPRVGRQHELNGAQGCDLLV
jgi:hypothetical protein